ncbi:hypothetical protein HYPDE_29103 [Hyphomicrobium denitrificans 1NES1]|uniref:Uncharacterized protein n=1 Tax=Hyphomicrobium denitrificans 1NES1 TaxID=670307 RepID=N0B216_9HYPH|nr:hypothetical protein HYPDE_29103 [Hyphomicrobium denitrificans 1NES1]
MRESKPRQPPEFAADDLRPMHNRKAQSKRQARHTLFLARGLSKRRQVSSGATAAGRADAQGSNAAGGSAMS